MLDALRTTLHHALVTPRGDSLAPVRVTKDLARRLNLTLGQPLCSAEDLQVRRRAQERLAELARQPRAAEKIEMPAAPVKVYFEGDRNAREVTRVRELLDSRNVLYELLDVAGDEAMIEFITRTAKCEKDELPIVFLGPTVIGGYKELVNTQLSGALSRPS